MTDQRLRDLERDAAHGNLQAQARLLLERVRAGDLTHDLLQLAAFAGAPAAEIALRLPALAWPSDSKALARAIAVWGNEPLVVAAAASATSALTQLEADLAAGPRAVIAAAMDWTACPCQDHAQRVQRAHTPAAESVAQLVEELRFEEAALVRAGEVIGWLVLQGAPTPTTIRRAASVLNGDRDEVGPALVLWALAPRRSST